MGIKGRRSRNSVMMEQTNKQGWANKCKRQNRSTAFDKVVVFPLDKHFGINQFAFTNTVILHVLCLTAVSSLLDQTSSLSLSVSFCTLPIPMYTTQSRIPE